jgi:type II secretion system protein J
MRGFTLMELLLAVAVFAIVLAAMNTVYFSALRLRNQTAAGFDAALPVEQAVARLKRDLAALRPPGGTLAGAFQTTALSSASAMESIGVRVSPDLYTSSALVDEWTPFPEVQKVAYFLANPTNQTVGRDLVRAVSRNLLPVTQEEIETQFVLEGVENVVFQYFDGSVWQDVWDSTTTSNLPFAIRVQIVMAQDPNVSRGQPANRAPVELVVPIKSEARTNQVATAGGQS